MLLNLIHYKKKLLVEPSRLGNTYKRKYKADIYFPPQLLPDLPSSSSNLFLLKIVAPTVSCISDNPFSITTSVCIVFIVFLQPRKALICDGCVMWIELESNNQHVPVNCHNRACYFIYPQLTAFSRVRKKCHNIVNWRWMLQLQKLKAVMLWLNHWTDIEPCSAVAHRMSISVQTPFYINPSLILFYYPWYY